MSIEQQYLTTMRRILAYGEKKSNRTGVGTLSLPGGCTLHADLRDGFPLLTTKRVHFKSIAVELEGFIRGVTSKKWFQERGCHIWDEWCNPLTLLGPGESPNTIDQLGPIYGAQWRHFGADEVFGYDGIDQLEEAINLIKSDPNSRRIVVSAWNPYDIPEMALPPCHMIFQFLANADNNWLDLTWTQRSADWFLGIPFNIASYALLLELVAKETGRKARFLTGNFADAHIYDNHREACREQLKRFPMARPSVEFSQWDGFWNWEAPHAVLEGYAPHPAIKAEVAV